jgi:hypothetical protein
VPSYGVGLAGQAALGAAVYGTAIRGLRPNPPASVVLSGTAPSLNSDVGMMPGLDAGEPAMQFPDIAEVPNPGVEFVVASVASTGISALAPAVSAVGHVWIAPGVLVPIGLPKLNESEPSAFPAVPAGRDELAGAGNVGAWVELGGNVTLGIAAIWAKHVSEPSEKIVAATRNKRRICASCAISD